MRIDTLFVLIGAPLLAGAAGCSLVTPPPVESSWTDERRVDMAGRSAPVYVQERTRPDGLMEEIAIAAAALAEIREETIISAREAFTDNDPGDFERARRRASPPPPPDSD